MNRMIEAGRHTISKTATTLNPDRFAAQHGQFSEKQIQKDSDRFFKESRFTVMEAQRLGKETLKYVSETFLAELETLDEVSDTQEARKRLQTQATLCLDLTNEQEEIRNAAIEKLFQTEEGEEVRREIILQTRENMAGILYENPKERKGRKTYTHQEVVFHMEDVLANIYAASAATLGFFPNEEQLYATVAMVNGHNILKKDPILDIHKHKKESKGVVIDVKTGEGKSAFIAGATAIVQALHNKGVHVATENDYLAREEAEYAAKLASAMGMTVGLLQETKPEEIRITPDGHMLQKQLLFFPDYGPVVAPERNEAYSADITCGQRYEFEFDSLHDTRESKPQYVRQVRKNENGTIQKDWTIEDAYAILDEADAVLLLAGITPSSLEGPAQETSITIHNHRYTETELRMVAAHVAGALTKNTSSDWQNNPDGDYVLDHGRAFLITKEPDLSVPSEKRFIGGLQKVEALLRNISIPTDKEPKPPLLEENEFYVEGKKGQQDLQSLFNRFLFFALQAEIMKEGEDTYRLEKQILVDPETKEEHKIASVILLGKHTNRDEPLSRFQYGLSAALEAKHKRIEDAKPDGYEIVVKPESTVFASTTTGAYWSSYKGLSGMTGTANEQMPPDAKEQLRKSSAQEYSENYGGLRVIKIPRHKPLARIDYEEAVGYPTVTSKLIELSDFVGTFFAAKDIQPDLVDTFNQIDRTQQQGRPFLIGLSRRKDIDELKAILLQQEWFMDYNKTHGDAPITIQVLSAEDTKEEGQIIARAGNVENGPVITIASIAGRGTDIRLSNAAKKLGGLYAVEGEAARMNTRMQFNGRAGRQGDPGETRQFLSLEDPLFIKAFGEQWVADAQKKADGGYVSATAMREYLLRAQAKLANEDIDAREALFRDYETVSNQLQPLYRQRRETLFAETGEMQEIVETLAHSYIRHLLLQTSPQNPSTLQLRETDAMVSELPMSDDDAVIFLENLEKIIPLSKETEAELFAVATDKGKRAVLDSAVNVFMVRYANLSRQVLPMVEKIIASYPPEQIADLYPQHLIDKPLKPTDLFDIHADTKPNLLDIFDNRLSPYLTDLLDLRQEVLQRGSGERLPADSFRLEAGNMYRQFIPNLQANMLRTVLSPNTYTFMAGLRLYNLIQRLPEKQVPVLTPKPEEPDPLAKPDEFYTIMTYSSFSDAEVLKKSE